MRKLLRMVCFIVIQFEISQHGWAQSAAACMSNDSQELRIAVCTQFIAKGVDVASALVNRGDAFLNTMRPDLALEDATRALSMNPSFSYAWGLSALSKVDLDRNDEALSEVNNAIRLDPARPQFYNARAHILWNMRNLSAAWVDVKKALSLDSKFSYSYVMRATLHIGDGNLDAALADVNILEKLDAHLYRAVGPKLHVWIDIENKKWEKAQVAARKYLEHSPRDSLTKYFLAYAYLKAGDKDRARSLARSLPESENKYYKNWLQSGHLWGFLDDAEVGVANLSKALALNPRNAKSYIYRARAYRLKGERKPAHIDIAMAIERDPEDPEAYAEQCLTLAADENLEAAISSCEKAIARVPLFFIEREASELAKSTLVDLRNTQRMTKAGTAPVEASSE